MKLFFMTIYFLITLGLVGCGEKSLPAEHLSIEGFVKAVEINRSTTWFGFDIVMIGFEDGRVKFFDGSSLPDMVKQGSNNKIFYHRTHNGDGTFYDKIEGLVKFPDPKETK